MTINIATNIKGGVMIKLKNVSKYYHSKGMIASGISKVNLEFAPGEFVVITGESGSGKSTLLNVISGLDSYEEGEMYIHGQETSHYMAADFEEYRKKYIGNIFQEYNLIGSYSVYQNVELILRINGYKKKDIKRRAGEIIQRVGLSEFRNTKASKLSGGQKQRVAIARALAKDTDIIVADEPTGNLDSKSAEEIAKLLSDISADKLVVVVTHNFDQFEGYATRQIKMHDGKVIEDLHVDAQWRARVETAGNEDSREGENESQIMAEPTGKISAGSQFRLGIRNTFNIAYKLILLLIVFVFLIAAVGSQYTSYLNQREEAGALGYNSYFYNFSNDRIVLKKEDKSAFTDEDYDAIKQMPNVAEVVPEDILLDSSFYIENDDFSYEAFPHGMEEFTYKVHKGRMPEAENEVILRGQKNEYSFSEDQTDDILGKECELSFGEDSFYTVKVVGISFDKDEASYEYAGKMFLSESLMSQVLRETYKLNSTFTTTVNGKAHKREAWDPTFNILPSSKVKKGQAVGPEDLNGYYDKGDAKGKEITVAVDNIYFSDSIKLKTADLYNNKNFTAKTGDNNKDANFGGVYISQQDYNNLLGKGNYQSTVYVDNLKEADETVKALNRAGYTTLSLNAAKSSVNDEITSIVQMVMIAFVLLAAFFICYVVIRLILKSRTGYFSILRMLGLAKKNIRNILNIEMITVANIAYALMLSLCMAVKFQLVQIDYVAKLIEYVQVRDYVIMYVIVLILTLIISTGFLRNMFKKTAIGSFREE